MGLSEVVPLNMAEFSKDFGPGYDVGYFKFPSINDRRDGCVFNAEEVAKLEDILNRLYSSSSTASSLREFTDLIAVNGYHEVG